MPNRIARGRDSRLALSLALPRKYLSTSAPRILAVYIYYIPAMAYNGVLEAFLASAAAPSDFAIFICTRLLQPL